MKYVYRLALAILTFAIGVTISPIRFDWESIACGPQGSSTSYRSSYFIHTSKSYIHFDSEAEASEAFKKKLSEAITIYDISPQVNTEGLLIEQHAVALFYDQGNDDFYVVSFWKEGQGLHRISSRSYTHVKELEKRYLSIQ